MCLSMLALLVKLNRQLKTSALYCALSIAYLTYQCSESPLCMYMCILSWVCVHVCVCTWCVCVCVVQILPYMGHVIFWVITTCVLVQCCAVIEYCVANTAYTLAPVLAHCSLALIMSTSVHTQRSARMLQHDTDIKVGVPTSVNSLLHFDPIAEHQEWTSKGSCLLLRRSLCWANATGVGHQKVPI